MYLFDAQNRWGYETSYSSSLYANSVYLFDAQNRWGYELMTSGRNQLKARCIYSMLRIVGVMSYSLSIHAGFLSKYLFDAQNRWGYEFQAADGYHLGRELYLFDAQNRWGYEVFIFI